MFKIRNGHHGKPYPIEGIFGNRSEALIRKTRYWQAHQECFHTPLNPIVNYNFYCHCEKRSMSDEAVS
ncbi:hypothetical protein [Winogradskyella sp.]|uniref:hypothetical protein n=1 Tax=Winogradskyella sp. TaxID=1883156 RepID=UPI002355C512|nr:hypothetical protein [Winogradskyella sp.]